MVTFGEDGFVKKRYRKFDIKTKGAEKNDYAMLKEVLSRRFKRALLEKGNYLSFPDLLLIDGGKGQYSAAKYVLTEFGLHDLPIIAIAKGKLRNSGNETFFYNGKTFKFEKNDTGSLILKRKVLNKMILQ
jgi:excinuclease ABC subunit C